MIRPRKIAAAVTFAAGLAVGMAASASSTTVTSSVGYFGPVNNVNYANQATADDYQTGRGTTYTNTYNPSKTVPAGWIGSEARIFYSDGRLCKTSGVVVTTTPATGFGCTINNPHCTAGNKYSYGKSATYNGNGTTYTYTFRSPLIYQDGQ